MSDGDSDMDELKAGVFKVSVKSITERNTCRGELWNLGEKCQNEESLLTEVAYVNDE